ncbi:MAG: M1 family aminopeptidase [Pseudomonadota bacterium]
MFARRISLSFPRSFKAALAALLILALHGAGTWAGDQSPPAGKLPAGVTPTRYAVDLDIDPSSKRFSGQVRIDVELEAATRLIWFHGRSLKVAEAKIIAGDGSEVAATYAESKFVGVAGLRTEREVGPGKATIAIHYSADFGGYRSGLYNVKFGGRPYAFTQFQPLRARRTFPSFDEPRFKTPFDVSITVAGHHKAVSNGPEKRVEELSDGRRRYVFAPTRPIPTYLVAIAVGDLDIVEWQAIPPGRIRDRPVPLRGIAPKGHGEKIRFALASTAPMLDILEEYFDSPYPYAKIDLVAAAGFGNGGMENVGAIFYGLNRVLLGDAPSPNQLRRFASIHAHELAHSWFGNLVTPAWWDDLWLNEAFATWMSGKVMHAWRPDIFDRRGPVRSANRAKRTDRLGTARQIRQPIRDNGDIRTAFDSITYSKGASVLAMVEQYVGEDSFRDSIRSFVKLHRHGVVSAKDFFDALAASANDPDLLQAFRSFVDQPGVPLIEAGWSCTSAGEVTVGLRQSRSLPLGSRASRDRRWTVPLCLAFWDGDSRRDHCLLMKERKASVRIPVKSCPTTVMPNARGAAYLNFTVPPEGWDALIARFDTLEAGEALTLVSSAYAGFQAGTVTTRQFLAVAEAAARSPNWDIARAPMQALRELKLFVLPAERQAEAKALLRQIYAPALARIDVSEAALAAGATDFHAAMLRKDLIWFMALDAGHAGLRRTLNKLGQAYVGYGTDGKVKPEVIHADLARAALIVAAETEGVPFVEALIKLHRSTQDAALRTRILSMLAYSHREDVRKRIWRHIMDPATPRREAGQLFWRQGRRAANARALFDWTQENFDELLKRLPRSHHKWMPWRTSGFCDAQSREEVAAFYSDRTSADRGSARILSNVLEVIDICVAYRERHRNEALELLAERQ